MKKGRKKIDQSAISKISNIFDRQSIFSPTLVKIPEISAKSEQL